MKKILLMMIALALPVMAQRKVWEIQLPEIPLPQNTKITSVAQSRIDAVGNAVVVCNADVGGFATMPVVIWVANGKVIKVDSSFTVNYNYYGNSTAPQQVVTIGLVARRNFILQIKNGGHTDDVEKRLGSFLVLYKQEKGKVSMKHVAGQYENGVMVSSVAMADSGQNSFAGWLEATNGTNGNVEKLSLWKAF